VVVHALEVVELEEVTGPGDEVRKEATLRIECGGGTYVRTLIVDLARAIGSAAHMTALERVKQGPFALPERGSDAGVVHTTILSEEDFSDPWRVRAAIEATTAAVESSRPCTDDHSDASRTEPETKTRWPAS